VQLVASFIMQSCDRVYLPINTGRRQVLVRSFHCPL